MVISTLCLSSTVACTSNRTWICRYLCSFDSISSVQFFQSLLATEDIVTSGFTQFPPANKALLHVLILISFSPPELLLFTTLPFA